MAESVLTQTYTQFGGKHAETASLTNILAAQGIIAPHTGKPFSEAMVLGIAGGLGAGYILWEFKEHGAKVLVYGWQNRWQYPIQFYENLCSRLNLKPSFHETGSQKAAAQQLEDNLASGKAVVAWVDWAQMPYLQLPKSLEGHIGHFISIYGLEDGDCLVDDLAAKPFRVPTDIMASARGRIGSYKNRLLSVTSVGDVDLPAAIMAGIEDEIEHLSKDSDSFSLPTIQKWGKMMTHRKNPKGWHVVFADRRGLYGALKSVYEGVELVSTGGGGMRGLYADFLDEAASILNRPALREVAGQYRSLAVQWSAFASSALPDNVEPLRETRQVLRQRYELLMTNGGDGLDALQPLTDRLNKLYAESKSAFPMSDAEIDTLFSAMGDGLLALYDAEKAALHTLSDAMD
jgi:hypothetical protein